MNERFVKAATVGVVAAAAALIFAPSVAAAARPLVRRGLKTAVKAYAKGRETVAEVLELAEDAYAEAWAELRAEAEEVSAPGTESEGADVKKTRPRRETTRAPKAHKI